MKAEKPAVTAELRELSLRARGGDLDAAYAILAEQVPVETWVSVIQALARKPNEIDLELVAHRTLRRPPVAVVAAVLELIREVGDSRAAFVARAIAALRSEEHLRKEARTVVDELLPNNSPVQLLADRRPTDAVYAVLARSIEDQIGILTKLHGDEQMRDTVCDALRAEYERLQDLARDTRWRSGSYRHFLRHALADLALIAQVGGKLEDQAFRLLQQRTEDPESNRELLVHLPAETRSSYLSWVLNRPSGKEETARTLFALGEIELRYPSDLDLSAVRRLLASIDVRIAVAAASLLVRSAPENRSDDRAIADLIDRASVEQRSALIERIVEDAPQRIRLDLWPPEVDSTLGSFVSGDVTEALVRTFEESDEPKTRDRALRLIVQRIVDESRSRRVAASAITRTTDPTTSEVVELLAVSSLRHGLWSALESTDEVEPPAHLVASLVERENPTDSGARLASLYASLPTDKRAIVEEIALAGIAAGTVAHDSLGADDALGVALSVLAAERRPDLDRRLANLLELVEHGDLAAEIELAREVQPLVDRAIGRSVGNERLIDDYRRLVSATGNAGDSSSAEPTAELDPTEVKSVASPLAKAGIHVALEDHAIVATIDAGTTDVAQLRALAIADQRTERAPQHARHTSRSVRSAVAMKMAEFGLAERGMRDLAERGPLLGPMTALSTSARDALFEAALASGVVVPDEWVGHPILGSWISSRQNVASTQDADPTGVLSAYQRAARELRETEERLAASRDSARRAFVSAADSALANLEETLDAYVQLWLGLERLGIRRVATPGAVVAATDLEPERFEIVGDARVNRYIVRLGGVIVGDEVIRRARVEAYE